MKKFVVSVRTNFGFVGVEGDSIEEVIEQMINLPELVEKAYARYKEITFPKPPPPVPEEKPELEGIIERAPDGTPQIIVPLEKLSLKEAVYLIMYAEDPKPLKVSEIVDLVSKNLGKVASVSDYLTKKEYRSYVIVTKVNAEKAYLLSGPGKNLIKKEILPKLKSLVTQ